MSILDIVEGIRICRRQNIECPAHLFGIVADAHTDQAGTALAIEWRVRHTSKGLAQSSGVDHRRLANHIRCDLPRILRHDARAAHEASGQVRRQASLEHFTKMVVRAKYAEKLDGRATAAFRVAVSVLLLAFVVEELAFSL